MLRLPVMQCEVEVLDNIDLAMYCLELSEKKKKKKSTILIMTLSTVAVITLSKEILKRLENISLFQARNLKIRYINRIFEPLKLILDHLGS